MLMTLFLRGYLSIFTSGCIQLWYSGVRLIVALSVFSQVGLMSFPASCQTACIIPCPAIMCCTCVLPGFVKLLSLRKHFFFYLFPEHCVPEHLLGCFVPNGMVNTADVLLPVCFYMK